MKREDALEATALIDQEIDEGLVIEHDCICGAKAYEESDGWAWCSNCKRGWTAYS